MEKIENKLPYKKQGKKLKISILKAGFDTLKECAEAAQVSYFMLRDYCCGKCWPNQELEAKILSAIKVGKKQ